MENERKYEVTIIEKEGTCNTELFAKMASRGDLQGCKLSEIVGVEVEIIGYAKCKIETNEKSFELYYFDTNEYGLFTTGSEIFADSVKDYLSDTRHMRLTEVKTKKGKTYKAVPVLNSKVEE